MATREEGQACKNCRYFGKLAGHVMPGVRPHYRECNVKVHGINVRRTTTNWMGPEQWCQYYEAVTTKQANEHNDQDRAL